MQSYGSLRDYILTRAREAGYTSISLSEALGFGRSYINAIINDQFTPSRKRCWQIAEFFGDNPNVILGLAGYYQPPDDANELVDNIAGIASILSRRLKRDLLNYAEFLRSQAPSPASRALKKRTDTYDFDAVYVELPNGEHITVDLSLDCTHRLSEIPSDDIADAIAIALEALTQKDD
jgi:transcriptional regulator with XRE-family HTH domain